MRLFVVFVIAVVLAAVIRSVGHASCLAVALPAILLGVVVWARAVMVVMVVVVRPVGSASC